MIRKNSTTSIVTAAVVAVGTATATLAQGIPVFDITALTQQIEQLVQLKSQLDTMNQQLTQAQQLYGSLNKITNMGDIARLLNDPSIRKALPADFCVRRAAHERPGHWRRGRVRRPVPGWQQRLQPARQ